MSQTDRDIETVRRAVAGMAYVPSEASAAFERIMAELERLKAKVESLDEENLELRMGDDL